jgi:hypothetical protein
MTSAQNNQHFTSARMQFAAPRCEKPYWYKWPDIHVFTGPRNPVSLTVTVSPMVTFIVTVNSIVISQIAPAVVGLTASAGVRRAPIGGRFWTGIERMLPETASIFTTTRVLSSGSTPFAGRRIPANVWEKTD